MAIQIEIESAPEPAPVEDNFEEEVDAIKEDLQEDIAGEIQERVAEATGDNEIINELVEDVSNEIAEAVVEKADEALRNATNIALERLEDVAEFFDYDLDLSNVNRTKILTAVKVGFQKVWSSPGGKVLSIGAAIYLLAFKGGLSLAKYIRN